MSASIDLVPFENQLGIQAFLVIDAEKHTTVFITLDLEAARSAADYMASNTNHKHTILLADFAPSNVKEVTGYDV